MCCKVQLSHGGSAFVLQTYFPAHLQSCLPAPLQTAKINSRMTYCWIGWIEAGGGAGGGGLSSEKADCDPV